MTVVIRRPSPSRPLLARCVILGAAWVVPFAAAAYSSPPVAEPARRLPGEHFGMEPSVTADPDGNVIVFATDSRGLDFPAAVVWWRSGDRGRIWHGPHAIGPLPGATFDGAQGNAWVQRGGKDRFYLAYMAAKPGAIKPRAALFRRSDDGGRTWAAPKRLGDHTDKPMVAVSPDGKWLAFAFTDYGSALNGGRPVVFRSRDGGETWQPADPPPSAAGAQYQPFGLAVTDSGAVAAAWQVMGPGQWTVRLVVACSTPDGKRSQTALGSFAGDGRFPDDVSGIAMAMNGRGVVHVLYALPRDGLTAWDVFARFSDGLSNWSPPVRVSDDREARRVMAYPAIAADADRVHAAWVQETADGERHRVWYRRSDDGGMNWSDPLAVSRPDCPTALLDDRGFRRLGGHYISVADDGAGAAYVTWGVEGSGATRRLRRGELWCATVR